MLFADGEGMIDVVAKSESSRCLFSKSLDALFSSLICLTVMPVSVVPKTERAGLSFSANTVRWSRQSVTLADEPTVPLCKALVLSKSESKPWLMAHSIVGVKLVFRGCSAWMCCRIARDF
jgi:hypothetical protein